MSWSSGVKIDGDQVKTVMSGLHFANGLMWGPHGEILLADASGGILNIVKSADREMFNIVERVGFESTIDNPTYFPDPYPACPDQPEPFYVVGGLARAVEFSKNIKDPNAMEPALVWSARRKNGVEGGWEKRLIMEDDGRWMSGISTALIVAIDPGKEGGRRLGWLVVTGSFAKALGVLKVEL